MSKPDKYKTPAEKGVAVPATVEDEAPSMPFMMRYSFSGAGATRLPGRPSEYRSHRETMFVTRASIDTADYMAGDPKKKTAQNGNQSSAEATGSDVKGKGKAK